MSYVNAIPELNGQELWEIVSEVTNCLEPENPVRAQNKADDASAI